jgi:hypothetical protein
VRKLTDSDKQEILKLYRETAETTSTLAERYGVSNSTISRLLKSTLPEEEYEFLVSLKRAARTPEGRAQVSYEQLPLLTQPPLVVEASSSVRSGGELLNPKVEKPTIEAEAEALPEPKPEALPEPEPENDSDFDFDQPIPANRRVKTRSSAVEKPKLPVIKETPIVKELEIVRHKPTETPIVPKPKIEVETRYSQPSLFAEILDEDLLDEPDDLEDDDESLDDIINEICQVHDYPSFIKRYCRNEEVHPVSVIKVEFGIGDFDDFVSECSFNEDKFEEDFIDFLP